MEEIDPIERLRTAIDTDTRRRPRSGVEPHREGDGTGGPTGLSAGRDTAEERSEHPNGRPSRGPSPERSTTGGVDADHERSTDTVVVLGSGYAGTGAIDRLESRLDEDATLIWISDVEHHLLLHEAHRAIRDPDVRERIAVPIEEIKRPETRFVHGEVTDVDTAARAVELADGSTIGYDYAVVALGSKTAFFGIDGLDEHALTLDSLEDVFAVRDALEAATRASSEDDPARAIVGGAGLAGVQCAGEIAALRDERSASFEITLVEGLEHVHPNGDPELQGRIRKHLRERDIELETGAFVRAVDETTVSLEDGRELEYNMMLWTGGVTARHATEMLPSDADEPHRGVPVASTLETSDERVFAVGDSALVPGEDGPVPPTAQAARQAAAVAGENVVRAIRDRQLETWGYEERGTLVSIGDATVAHDVDGIPVTTFGGPVAALLKRTVSAAWLARIANPTRAIRSW